MRVKEKETLIAIASWSEKDEEVTLTFDFKALGIDATKAKLVAPPLESFNRANKTVEFDLKKPIAVPALKGWLLVLSESCDD